MDAPSLKLIPPIPATASPQPSPLSTETTTSSDSSLPEFAQLAADRDRTSTETTIVTIYSMYEDEGSWSPSAASHLEHNHRQQASKDLATVTVASFPEYSDSYIQVNSRPLEDSGYYDATYDVMRPSSKRLSMSEGARTSGLSDDSTQLAYSDSTSRPPSTYPRTSSLSGTRITVLSDGNRLSHLTSPNGEASSPPRSKPPSRQASRPPSRTTSRPPSRTTSRPSSQHRKSVSSHGDHGLTASGPSTPYSSPRPPSGPVHGPHSPASLPFPQTPPLLQVPATPPRTSGRALKISSPESKHSVVSITPSEGEDPDAFHVRSTYAQLEVCGVKRDGVDEGVERTRARVGGNRASELRAEEALADDMEKTRDLTAEEIDLLSSLDRYGFFVTPSHDRQILLPAAPLLKPLHKVTTSSTQTAPSAPILSKAAHCNPPPKESRRTAKWGRMLVARSRDEGGNVDMWDIHSSKESKLRERTFKGIPDCWRSAAWEVLMNRYTKSGKRELQRLKEAYQAALDLPSTYDVQIDLDVPRTISGHVMFRTRYGLGQRSLFHVLHCLSLHCDECGYCQGMGPIAATLLCYFDPARVYASLVRIHDAYAMHDIFSPGFPGLLEAIYVQERLMEQMMPGVYAAFKKHMISTTSYATKWYITLFANSVPFQAQLRLWDAFLLEGYDVFVVVAIAIVWVYRDHITSESASFETVLSLLSSFFVPEDENALLSWIEKVVADKKIRANMLAWRQEWKRLVAEGKSGAALL